MILKHTFLLVSILLLISSNILSQKQKDADKYFKINKYKEALAIYQNLNNQSYEVKKNTAYCLKKLFKYKESQKIYANIINIDNVKDDTYFNYADVLNILGNYSKAIEFYNKVSNKELFNIEQRVKSCIWAKQNPTNFSEFKLIKTNIETSGLSLGSAPFQDGLVYSFAQEIKNNKTGELTKYYNLVFSKKIGEKKFSSPKELSNEFNTAYYEGSPSFNGNTIYFTRNSSEKDLIKVKKHKKYKVNSKGVNKLKIYTSKSISGKWSAPEELSFNNEEYSYTHPSISEDGNTLYFASDMTGGYGGYDLYKCTKNNLGKWSNPQNLGDKINTKGNEMFPFITGAKLYFSSREHKGYGGADVFVSSYKDEVWTTPKNMGLGVNTSQDDFGFSLNKNMKSGYMSSNREGKNGYDYIYIIKPAIELDSVLAFVKNNFDKKPVKKPFVLVRDKDGVEVKTEGENGKVRVKGSKDEVSVYTFDADGYAPKEFNLDNFDKEKLSNIELDPLLRGTTTNSITDEAVAGVTVYAIDKLTGEKVASMVTGKDGKWALVLPEDREYDIVFEKDGFSKTIVNVKANERGDEIRTKLNTIDLQPNAKKGNKMEIRNIYFDHAKATIKPEAYKTLDNIVKFLNKNPKVKIELSAHTDMVGKDSYNLRLSDKRAKAAAKYVVSKGISKRRVKGKGYGEKYILNRCKSYRAKCSDAEHAVNRRVEMKIL